MSNLEELNIYIGIKNRTAFIDGIYIDNEILVHMPRLHIFNFSVYTETEIDRLVHHLSEDDIQRTFTNKIYQHVNCHLNYGYRSVTCHAISSPFRCYYLTYLGNTFPNFQTLED